MAPAPKHSYEEERAMIMQAAVQCVTTASITDFTMSALSKAAGMSMGSVYKHIRTKEDVIVSLATEGQIQLLSIFDRVLSLPLPFPVRLIALQLADQDKINHYPFGPEVDALVASEAFLKRASSEWVGKLMDANIAVEDRVKSALLNAIKNGEVTLGDQNAEALAEDIMVASWSMCVGFTQVARQRATRQLVGKGVKQTFPLSVDDSIIRSLKRLLNTYPWTQAVTDKAIGQACELLVENKLR